MKCPINDIDRPLDTPVRYLVPHYSCWKNYTCCPWAKSIIAIDPETERPILCPVTCKRWGCPYCAVRKIRKLAYLTNAAAPVRWIRMAVNPRNYTSPRDAWEKTSPLFPECFRQLRKIRNEPIEYLRVTELHASGFPHYHALLRCGYLPKQQLDDEWARLTAMPYPKRPDLEAAIEKMLAEGRAMKKTPTAIAAHNAAIETLAKTRRTNDTDSKQMKRAIEHERYTKSRINWSWNYDTGTPFNWIAKIDSTFSSFRYLVKYLTKLHKIEWTDRHVSYSRGFFPEEAREKLAFPERTIMERSDEHPWVYLSRRHFNEPVGVDDNGCYHLNDIFCGTPADLNRDDVGLPRLPEKTEPPPPKLVQATMLDDSEDHDYYTEGF